MNICVIKALESKHTQRCNNCFSLSLAICLILSWQSLTFLIEFLPYPVTPYPVMSPAPSLGTATHKCTCWTANTASESFKTLPKCVLDDTEGGLWWCTCWGGWWVNYRGETRVHLLHLDSNWYCTTIFITSSPHRAVPVAPPDLRSNPCLVPPEVQNRLIPPYRLMQGLE